MRNNSVLLLTKSWRHWFSVQLQYSFSRCQTNEGFGLTRSSHIVATLTSEQDREQQYEISPLIQISARNDLYSEWCLSKHVLKSQKQMDEFRNLKNQYETRYSRDRELKYVT